MKTLQVKNGDIVLDSGGRLSFVVGSSKLVQDLSLWLREEYGVGYTTPNFGSLLPGMIGQSLTATMTAQVYSEVSRIIELYRIYQSQQLQLSQNASSLSNWNKSEIIQSIKDILIQPGTGFIQVLITLTTLNSNTTQLNLVLTPNGIQVQNG